MGDMSAVRVVAECDFFLYRMVRKLTGLLVHVGLGRISVAQVRALVSWGDRAARQQHGASDDMGAGVPRKGPAKPPSTPQVPTAPAAGLMLEAVWYNNSGSF